MSTINNNVVENNNMVETEQDYKLFGIITVKTKKTQITVYSIFSILVFLLLSLIYMKKDLIKSKFSGFRMRKANTDQFINGSNNFGYTSELSSLSSSISS